MWLKLAILLLSASVCLGANTTIRFDGGTNGEAVSVASLTASTSPTNAGYWEVTGGNMWHTNVSVKGSGTLGFATKMSTTAGYAYFYPTNPAPGKSMSVGAWVRWRGANTDSTSPDFYWLASATGNEFANCKLLNFSPCHIYELEQPGIGSTYGSVNICSNTWFWVTILYSTATNHQIWTYDANTNLVDQIVPAGDASSEDAAARLLIGINNGAQNTDEFIDMDSMVVDHSATPAFPLLPSGDPPATGSTVNIGTLNVTGTATWR